MHDPRALFDEGGRLAAAGRWEEAAERFTRAALVWTRAEATDLAFRAWEAAGETWRRGDRPADALRALRAAIELDPRQSLIRVRLAGVRAELGDLSGAAASCRRVLAGDAPDAVRAAAADTLIGALIGQGRPDEAAALLPLLGDPADPRSGAAWGFRAAQLHRLAGALDAAQTSLDRVLAGLAGLPGAAAGQAAVYAEQGELALCAARWAEATTCFEAARVAHTTAGRRASAWSARAGGVRAAIEAGVRPLAPELDEAVGWAASRGLVPLELEVRTARGMLRATHDPAGAAADLDDAIRRAGELGLPLAAGRARLARAAYTPMAPASARALLESALDELAPSVPEAARAAHLLAEVLRRAAALGSDAP